MLFSQIIGHEDIKKKLIQSVKENRIAHAQLFLGQKEQENSHWQSPMRSISIVPTKERTTAAVNALLVRNSTT